MQRGRLPGPRLVDQGERDTAESTSTWRRDERAIDALRESSTDASTLAGRACGTSAERLELCVQCLGIKTVLESERSTLPVAGRDSDGENEGGKEGVEGGHDKNQLRREGMQKEL